MTVRFSSEKCIIHSLFHDIIVVEIIRSGKISDARLKGVFTECNMIIVDASSMLFIDFSENCLFLYDEKPSIVKDLFIPFNRIFSFTLCLR